MPAVRKSRRSVTEQVRSELQQIRTQVAGVRGSSSRPATGWWSRTISPTSNRPRSPRSPLPPWPRPAGPRWRPSAAPSARPWPEPPRQRPGWFGRIRDAHARLDQAADALDRLVQRQATGPGQTLDRTGAVNRARDGPLLPAEYGRGRAEIAQPDWRGADHVEACHPFGLLDHLGEHEVDTQA